MKKTLLGIMVWAALSQGITAQTDSIQINLQSLDVTAQRAKLYSTQARVITVIDRKAIDQMPVTNIDQLLDNVAGVDIRNRGIGGTQADISLRGGSFDQVLVLLNGVNITDPQTGHYNLDIPVELSDVVRVEILQGSAARIYGPNAFSGAINIVTEKKSPSSLSLQTAGGSYNTFMENVSARIGNDKIHTYISGTHKSSDGYMSNTDYDIKNAFSQTVYETQATGKIGLQLAYQEKSYGANGFYSLAYPNQFDHTQTAYAALDWQKQLNSQIQINAQAYDRLHYDRFELFRDMENAPSWYTGHNYHLTQVSGAKLSASYVNWFGKISLGADIRDEHIYSTVLGTTLNTPITDFFDKDISFTKSANRFLPSTYADYAFNSGKFFASAGLSVTLSSPFGTLTAGGLDFAYHFTDDWRVYLSANSAVRLPTFTDLYYKSATQLANPDLQPEKAKTIEAGSKYEDRQFKASAALFYRMGKNVIDWIKEPDSTKWQSQNLTEVNALGLDLSAQYRFQNGFIRKISIDYSYLTLDKSAGTFDSKYALDYMKQKAVFTLEHSIFSKLSANWEAGYYDRAGNYTAFDSGLLTNYKPYFMANVRVLWSEPQYDIYMDVNNLTDTKYADYGGLTQPGANFMAGIKLRL